MSIRTTGRYERSFAGGEEVRAFVPVALPPHDPPLRIEGGLAAQLQRAERALSRLELAGEMVPSLDWFIYAFVRKEAVLSSQIEGTQATLVDLLNHEATPGISPPNADVEEVCNYLEAMSYARSELANPVGLPLSMRLLNGTHQRLLRGSRGENKRPGEVRRSQNWIGGSRPGKATYVPPPPNALPDVLSAFERYFHADDELPPLIRAGLLHVQFETIHPYLDGNGRIGRLLITLLLEHWGLLTRPLLYLSLFFKRHPQEYYGLLNAVRAEGDWEGWLDFYLEGVATIAEESVAAARELSALVAADRQRLLQHERLTLPTIQIFEQLPGHPTITAPWVVEALATTKPTANRAIDVLVSAGVLVETTGMKRGRMYTYQRYVDRLREGTELTR